GPGTGSYPSCPPFGGTPTPGGEGAPVAGSLAGPPPGGPGPRGGTVRGGGAVMPPLAAAGTRIPLPAGPRVGRAGMPAALLPVWAAGVGVRVGETRLLEGVNLTIGPGERLLLTRDRKSTRLNSSHVNS